MAAAWVVVRHVLHLELTSLFARIVTASGAEWVMYLLVALSVLGGGVALERWLYFSRRQLDVEAARLRLDALLRDGRDDEARAFAQTLPGMEGQVVRACLSNLHRGPEAMNDAMLARLSAARLDYERNLVVLGTLGNNAPFVGLFGTVLGIIKAFADLAADLQGGAEAVMAGISEALVATGIGLLVAIPSVVAFNALRGQVKVAMSQTETLARTIASHAHGRRDLGEVGVAGQGGHAQREARGGGDGGL